MNTAIIQSKKKEVFRESKNYLRICECISFDLVNLLLCFVCCVCAVRVTEVSEGNDIITVNSHNLTFTKRISAETSEKRR